MELKKNNLTEQLFNLLNNRKQKDRQKINSERKRTHGRWSTLAYRNRAFPRNI